MYPLHLPVDFFAARKKVSDKHIFVLLFFIYLQNEIFLPYEMKKNK